MGSIDPTHFGLATGRAKCRDTHGSGGGASDDDLVADDANTRGADARFDFGDGLDFAVLNAAYGDYSGQVDRDDSIRKRRDVDGADPPG